VTYQSYSNWPFTEGGQLNPLSRAKSRGFRNQFAARGADGKNGSDRREAEEGAVEGGVV